MGVTGRPPLHSFCDVKGELAIPAKSKQERSRRNLSNKQDLGGGGEQFGIYW